MAGQGVPLLALLIIVILVAASSVVSGWTRPGESLQDVSLVIKYRTLSYSSPAPQSAYCLTNGEKSTPKVMPKDVYTSHASDGTDTMVELNAAIDVRGLTCSTGGKQDVIGPVIHPQGTLIPSYHSVTLNKGDDLRLPLIIGTHSRHKQVLWRKESLQDSSWNTAILSLDELVIPSDNLQGSGVYSVKVNSTQTHQHGVVLVLVRECPEHRCGHDCSDWCRDCLNGGMWDDGSGRCLCPAGVKGDRCQEVCQEGYIGHDCNVYLGSDPIGQVVCLSAPLGCTCAPGYRGEDCATKCSTYSWGVDCAQTCLYCYNWYSTYHGRLESCSSWGNCPNTKRRRCKEGDLGLPRLRQPPTVTSITAHSAAVSFEAWDEDDDDGDLPSGGILFYKLQYWPREGTKTKKYKTVRNPTTTTLTDLEPGMTYNMKVLVMVKVDNDICDADESGRGRVHMVTFLTACPEPPKLKNLKVKPGSTSLEVWWNQVSYQDRCGFQGMLFITSEALENENSIDIPKNTYYKKVTDLEPNTEYTVSLYNYNQNKSQGSAPTRKTTKTLPGGLDVNGMLQGDAVDFYWSPKSGSAVNLEYKTYYEINSNGKSFSNDSWSGWSSETRKTIPVFPYSTVKLYVYVKNDAGQGQMPYNSIVEVPPSEPGKVLDLKVTSNGTSLLVSWRKPSDNPPRGRLESYRVTWSAAGQTLLHDIEALTWNMSYCIPNLTPNTTYEIKVKAKNADVLYYGAPATTTATTTMGIPSQVAGLTVNASQSSLSLTWRTPEDLTGITTWYNVSLYRSSNNVLEENVSVNEPHAKFEGLSIAHKYRAEVAACNINHCGNVQTLQCWTLGPQPHLEGTADLVTASDTTITILIPLLTNPPGWHFVAVQREGREPQEQGWEDKLKEAALNLVRREDEVSLGRSRRSLELEEVDNSSMYITTKVLQDEDERLEVTVGDNKTYEGRYHNRPLEKDAAYWIIVVTEKKSEHHKERVVSVPHRFVVSPYIHLGTVVRLIVRVTFGAVVLVVVAVLAMKCLTKRKAKMRARNDNHYDVAIPPCELLPEDSPLPMVAINNGQNNFEEDIYANETLKVLEKDLESYLLRAVQSRDTKMEFDDVPSHISTSYAESDLPENRSKNRYRNKVTYDDTRVILPLHEDIPHSDYINANYVEGPVKLAAFIATQGPLEVTVGAFWRMLWHTNCRVVVMVANLQEGKKVKVALYWPEGSPWTTEGVTVTPTRVTVKMDFVIRTFTMSVGNTSKEITQYHYTAWPDHGVPKIPYGLAQMIKLLRSEHPHTQPLTVHCSAGIGRTGTVILVMYLLDELEARGDVQPKEALMALRRGRGRLVENTEQYIFVHQVVHEVLFGLKTSFYCHSFEEQLSVLISPQPPEGVSLLHQQYKKLTSLPKDLSFKYGKDPTCAHLNRNQDILPADGRMVCVQGDGYGPDRQYLNVIRVNGIDQKDAYLVGEHPQSHTVGKMWRLVYERKVAVWVLIHTFPDDDPEFPDVVSESSYLLSNMTVKASPAQTFQNFDERRVEIYVKELGTVHKHTCLLITLKGWPTVQCIPVSPKPLLAVIERAEALSSQQKPPLFTCKDGVTGCGVVAALLLAVSRAKLVQEVDIYRSVASIQQDRPQFIVNLKQYSFLHTAMATFLNDNDHYGNFN